jgi:four helix bundle protein
MEGGDWGNEMLLSVERRESRAYEKNMKQFRFQKLDVWQQARLLNKKIYELSRAFPTNEAYALTSQIRRASISVSSNIAEGSGRNSDADFAYFLEIAYASLMEVISQLYLALDQGYISENQLEVITAEADFLASQLVALSKTLGRVSRTKLP